MVSEGIGPLVRQAVQALNAVRGADNPRTKTSARDGGEKAATTVAFDVIQVSESALARFAAWQARHGFSRPGAAPLPTGRPGSEVDPPTPERTYRPLPRQAPPPGGA